MACKRRATEVGTIISQEAVFSNADLLQEILLRIPAMTLLRYKCVAKLWLSIISDSKFVSFHIKINSRSPVSGLCISSDYPQELEVLSLCSHTSTPSLSFLSTVAKKLFLIDSCNGLLLFYCSNPCCYLVCNPTTHQYTLLPKNRTKGLTRPGVLVFDPSKSPHYKAVIVYWHRNRCQFDIFSSATRFWEEKDLQSRVPMPSDISSTPCVYWEGAIHWMVCNNRKDNFHCRFDVDAKELDVTPLPPVPRIYNGENTRFFVVSGGGSLLRIQKTSKCYKILEMGKGCGSWTVKHDVCLQSCFSEIGSNPWCMLLMEERKMI